MFTLVKNIYRSFFRKDETLLWRQFAVQIGGKFHMEMGQSHVVSSYKGIDIQLCSYTHYIVVGAGSTEAEYTVGKIFFDSADGFKLCVTEEGWIEKLGKLFGLQDVRINDDEFDRKYLLKSSDETKTRRLLSYPTIKEGIQNVGLLRLEITNSESLFGHKPPSGEHMIYAAIYCKAQEMNELNDLLTLFKNLVDSLLINGTLHSPTT